MKDCTIIITNHNYAGYVGGAIESALGQSVPCEIVVYDDNSTDNSREVLADYESECSIFYFLGKQGIVGLRNYAMERIQTAWCIHLDADDELALDYVESCLEVATPEIGVIYTDVRFLSEISPWSSYGYVTKPEYPDSKGARKHGLIYGCAMYRWKCWDDVGGYDDVPFEDYDLFLGIEKLTKWRFKKANTHFIYRKHKGSRSHISDDEVRLEIEKIRAKYQEKE